MDSYSNDPASDLFLDSSCELKWPIQSLAGTRAVQKHSYTPPVDRISISKDHETIFCQTKYLRCASDILDTETRCVGGGTKFCPPLPLSATLITILVPSPLCHATVPQPWGLESALAK